MNVHLQTSNLYGSHRFPMEHSHLFAHPTELATLYRAVSAHIQPTREPTTTELNRPDDHATRSALRSGALW